MSKPEISLKFAEQKPPAPPAPPRIPQITGMVATDATEPTGTPRSFFEQFRIFDGALWFYDTVTDLWQTASAAASSTFLALTDTPDDYSGYGDSVVTVKPDATGLQFSDPEDIARRTSTLRVLDASMLFTERGMSLGTTGGGVTHMTNASMGLSPGEVAIIEAYTVATRVGGISGSAGDSAVYITRAAFKNVGGTVSLMGTSSNILEEEDQPAWHAELVVNSNQPTLDLTAAAGNTIVWQTLVKIYRLQ